MLPVLGPVGLDYPQIMTRRILAPAAIALLALGLAGCSFNAGLTVSPDTLAQTAATSLQEKLGGDTAEIDCGADAIIVTEGAEVECTYTDPISGEDYDAIVTIVSVNGSKFEINTNVPELPVGGADEPTDDGVISVTGDEIAGVAAGALAPQLGYDPVITCSDDVELVVDNSIRCMITDDQGTAATVLITITEVDGSRYAINAKVQ